MIDHLKETIKNLDDVKKGIDSLRKGLESGLFDKEDAVKLLSRISDRI